MGYKMLSGDALFSRKDLLVGLRRDRSFWKRRIFLKVILFVALIENIYFNSLKTSF